MPCCTLAITASSALRCSVSFSSRCVSSNRRALSNATAMLPASVSSRRRSVSVKAFSCSRLCTVMAPSDSALDPQWHPDGRLRRLALPGDFTVLGHTFGHAGVDEQRLAGLAHMRRKAACIGLPQALDDDALAALDEVGDAQQAAVALDDADAHDLGLEDLADLLAHQVIDRLHLQLRRQAGLYAVDDRQLGRALALGLVALGVEQRHAHAWRRRWTPGAHRLVRTRGHARGSRRTRTQADAGPPSSAPPASSVRGRCLRLSARSSTACSACDP